MNMEGNGGEKKGQGMSPCTSQVNIVINGHLLPGIINGRQWKLINNKIIFPFFPFSHGINLSSTSATSSKSRDHQREGTGHGRYTMHVKRFACCSLFFR